VPVKKAGSKSLEAQQSRTVELFAPKMIHESRNCSHLHSLLSDPRGRETLLVEHDVEQRTVNFQPTVVVNEA
jgi:hypothetical protein